MGKALKFQTQKNVVIMVTSFTLIIPLLSASTWFNKVTEPPESANIYIEVAYHNLSIS
jgi:fumarate reductase subunit C